MSRPSNPQPSQVLFGLPPRPVHSYQPHSRRRPHKKASKLKDQENHRPEIRAPRVRHNLQPLADASNMTSLQYNSTPSMNWKLPSKPSFVISPLAPQPLFAQVLHTDASRNQSVANVEIAPFYLPHLQPLRTVQLPQVPQSRSYNPTGLFPDSDQKTNLTPKTRRKLAVEGMRKAVSDAALRKMGIQAGFGWAQDALDQPITFTTEKQKPVEVHTEKPTVPQVEPFSPKSDLESDVQHPSYSPRQYTPKPLLLPCKLARSSNPTRSPPPFKGPLFSRQRTISYHRSRSPSELGCQTQPDMSDDGSHATESLVEAEELVKPNPRCSTVIEDGSTTPSDCSFASDPEIHSESAILSQVDGGSTTPCDSSFASDHVMELPSDGIRFESPDRPTEDISFEASQTDEKRHSRPKILDALVWTIAAPHRRAKDPRRMATSSSDNPHRKSLGYWLGASLPYAEPSRHNRASSEIVLIQRNIPRLDDTAHRNDIRAASNQNQCDVGRNSGDCNMGFSYQHEVSQGASSDRNEGLMDSRGLSDTPIAHPTFILPAPDNQNGLYTNLRNLASPPSLWSPLLRRIPSFSFAL
ncbi:hypothetical protein PGT21_005724 [Puccinia graminis f. sp. tritici]|uniref:Uncharacterized protein n=1 Tax=Puccinia graminis f. sp. tritici TaxID=56615 RepID=A0A5B0N7X2_PUCGR|nr:hypothetical protein PGT21_005724 [Puccinia graminis f. sp. tritici]KAA1129942.1 hypothetical protein PGTUg99_008710 [Puccinia graminis f. sp. tritici]